MSNDLQRRRTITRVLARPTLTHVMLQAELLLHEINTHRIADDMVQADVEALHLLVANALLFLDPDGQVRSSDPRTKPWTPPG